MATFLGSGLNDILNGSKLSDLMFGLAGNDSLSGGLGADTLDGGTGADTLAGGGGDDTLIGGAGNDSYKVNTASDVVIENPGEGADTVISTAFSYTLGASVENLTLAPGASIGSGNALANVITGNAIGNTLYGLDGNDTLIGNDGDDYLESGTGADSMVGGNGNDLYFVDTLADKVVESSATGGTDEVWSSISFTLGANLENLNLNLSETDAIDGTGNTLNNGIFGNAGNNVLSGLAGDDWLHGAAGNDLLLGGAGKDLLTAAEGNDTLVGGAGSDVFAFDSLSPVGLDVIADFNGLPGGDAIDVSGLLVGFVPGVSIVADFLQTVPAGGSTTIRVDRDGLGAGFAFVDMAVLQGVSTNVGGLLANGAIVGVGNTAVPAISGTAGADNKAGTASSDLILGLAGNDTLTGLPSADTLDGGTGADKMAGGGGNDTYVVDSATDVIVETAGDPNDRVLASISIDLNLPAYANIEHATLTGTTALNAIGNAGANMLIGNAGANVLDGKAGDDTLIGGAGNDTYKVDSFNDVIIENPGEGADTVISTVPFYILSAFVENLTLAQSALPNPSGWGNALANVITGNAVDNNLAGFDGNDTLIGNDGNDFLDGGAGADSLVGGNGNDVYVVDTLADKVVESSATGGIDTVYSAITYTLGANLDFLYLSGTDAMDGTGNAAANLLFGNAGDNVLSGLAGGDTLEGSWGDDLLLGGGGKDLLYAYIGNDTLVGGAGSDAFTFIYFGLSGVDNVIADFNGLPGGDAIDVSGLLVGFVPGISVVADFLQTVPTGSSTTIRVDRDGLGSSFAFVDMTVLQGVSTDLAGLLANGSIVINGSPIVPAASSLDGTAGNDSKIGTASSDLIRGLAGNDTLTGLAGADTLDGGTGADRLVGGTGNDTYVVDSATDVIVEAAGDADDRVLASISVNLNLAAYANIEHATLTGTTALNATGNDGANMLIGNGAANVLDGQAGDDTLIGGAGNDSYKVDSTADLVIENPGEGTDTVISTATFYTLGAFIENLTLASGAFFGSGNALANVITGNADNNVLSGIDGNDTLIGNAGNDYLDGGSGADSMVGGNGNDTYVVDTLADKAVESSATGGIDAVYSTITYTLGANLDNLTLSGTDAIDGTGNALNNSILGNLGNNVLSGLAGADKLNGSFGNDLLLGGDGKDLLTAAEGNDTLAGGAGSDVFAFNGLGLDGLDVIADFNGLPGGDALDVSVLLTGFVKDVSNVNDFLQAVQTGGSTTLLVDSNGAVGGAVFVDMCVLQGVTTSISGLLNNGSLILD